MALTPRNDEAFIREVDEELRREQIGTIWRRHGRLLAAALVAGLVLLAGLLWWQQHRQAQAGERGEALVKALDDLSERRSAAAKPTLDQLAGSSDEGYRAAAKLTGAAVALDQNDAKAAVASFKAVAEDPDAPQPFRDLALIRRTAAEFDTLPPAETIARLKPFATAGNPWFGSAGEMTAIALIRLNRTREAAALFATLAKDKSVPETIRLRASKVASGLGADALGAPAGPTKE